MFFSQVFPFKMREVLEVGLCVLMMTGDVRGHRRVFRQARPIKPNLPYCLCCVLEAVL